MASEPALGLRSLGKLAFRPGLGHAIAQAIAEAGINVMFLRGTSDRHGFSAVMGFEEDESFEQATTLSKKAVKKIVDTRVCSVIIHIHSLLRGEIEFLSSWGRPTRWLTLIAVNRIRTRMR